MSRAFAKKGIGGPDPLPDLPISSHPNHVTPTGLAALLIDPARQPLAEVPAGPHRGPARLCLGVLDRNPGGRAFWERMGFRPTGVSRVNNDHGLANLLHWLGKDL